MNTIVITYHNEPREFLMDCLKSLRDTIDIEHEIIIVDDCSDTPLLSIEGVRIIRNPVNLGVGQSFDTGVKNSKEGNIILMACDIRFGHNNWASKLIQEIENHPTSFTCTACVGLNERSSCCNAPIVEGRCAGEKCKNPEGAIPNMDFETRRLKSCHRGGATFLAFHDRHSDPAKLVGFQSILEAKWLPNTKNTESYEIPCILGAIYGVKKSWYRHIDGWWGHKQWGTLEPYISIKSWMMGGSCRIAPHIEAAHIFKLHGTHGQRPENQIYNKILTAKLFIDDKEEEKRFIGFLCHNGAKVKALKMARENEVDARYEYYSWKYVMTFAQLCEKFNIDTRKNGSK